MDCIASIAGVPRLVAELIFQPAFKYDGETSILAILGVPVFFFLLKGFLVLEPNKAAVMTFFGKYAGSVRDDGFFLGQSVL